MGKTGQAGLRLCTEQLILIPNAICVRNLRRPVPKLSRGALREACRLMQASGLRTTVDEQPLAGCFWFSRPHTPQINRDKSGRGRTRAQILAGKGR